MMLDLETGASALLGRDTVRALSRRSDARGLLQLAAHVALLAASGSWVWASHGSVWAAPALLVHGIMLCFLFCALHESIHGTAFATRWLNGCVAWTCGALLVLPPRYFRLFHFAHHRHTQDPARDPELAQPGPVTAAGYLWRISGLPYWRERLTVTLRHALTGRATEAFIPPASASGVVREARVLWASYLGVLALSVYLRRADALLYWVVPAILGQPWLRAFLLAEHVDCPLTADMLANTRTTRTNAAVLLLAWRMPYHAEHHYLPVVPFHALGRLHALIGARVRVTAPGYLALHRSLLRRYRAAGAAPRAA
ncbi:MAG TPA: fatty acid desaturase [Steroidobacteraceae bacterium]|nr:fatty acid desaturase [Steroidobacteraceae bacterium]